MPVFGGYLEAEACWRKEEEGRYGGLEVGIYRDALSQVKLNFAGQER